MDIGRLLISLGITYYQTAAVLSKSLIFNNESKNLNEGHNTAFHGHRQTFDFFRNYLLSNCSSFIQEPYFQTANLKT